MKIHQWLEGLSLMDNNSTILEYNADIFIENEQKLYPQFTLLESMKFYSANQDRFSERKIKTIYLPVNRDVHMLFYIIQNDFKTKVYYTDCHESCKILPPYRFPLASLKKSIDFSGNPEAMKSIKKGTFFYDSGISPRQHTPDLLVESLNKFKKFIDYSAKKD
jgi:hypothetical protein